MHFFDQYLTAPIWQKNYFENTLEQYLTAMVVFVALSILFFLFHQVLLGRLVEWAKMTVTDIDDTLIEIVRLIRPVFYIFLAIYIAAYSLQYPHILERLMEIILLVWVVYLAVQAGHKLINFALSLYVGEQADEGTKQSMQLLGKIGKWALLLLGGLFVLQNLGVNVTSLIAGLGIGGLAIALALQNVLTDLFSSFAIYLDKPFEPGDFIVTGAHMGTVLKIGIKTTRLKALQGEEIVISNKELTEARVQNFKKLTERRVLFALGVVYGTAQEKLEKIPLLIQRSIGEAKGARFDRAHFMRFGESSLDFEIVYYAQTSEYNVYMDMHQAILLGIVKAFGKEGIEMAFPTRTVHVAHESADNMRIK